MLRRERGTIGADHDERVARYGGVLERAVHARAKIVAALRMQRHAELRRAGGEERMRRIGRAPELHRTHVRGDRGRERVAHEPRVELGRAFGPERAREPRLHGARDGSPREHRDARALRRATGVAHSGGRGRADRRRARRRGVAAT